MRVNGLWDNYTPKDLAKLPKWLLAALAWEGAAHSNQAAVDNEISKHNWIEATITLIKERKPSRFFEKSDYPTSRKET